MPGERAPFTVPRRTYFAPAEARRDQAERAWVEAPGTAPGSERPIPMSVYRHSRPCGRQGQYKRTEPAREGVREGSQKAAFGFGLPSPPWGWKTSSSGSSFCAPVWKTHFECCAGVACRAKASGDTSFLASASKPLWTAGLHKPQPGMPCPGRVWWFVFYR